MGVCAAAHDTTCYERLRSRDHPNARHPRRRGLRSHLRNAPFEDKFWTTWCPPTAPCCASKIAAKKKSRPQAAQELTGRRQTEWTGATQSRGLDGPHCDGDWLTKGKALSRPCALCGQPSGLRYIPDAVAGGQWRKKICAGVVETSAFGPQSRSGGQHR